MKSLSSESSSLESTLCDVDGLAQSEVTYKFWGGASKHLKQINSSDSSRSPYWNFYIVTCAHALHDSGRHIAIRKHADVLQVAAQLEADLTRDEIKDSIRMKLKSTHSNEEEILENSINLVSSLLLMIHCGTFSCGFSGTELLWTQGSLRQHIAHYFSEKPVLSHERVKLEKNLTAPNLNWIAGLKVEWTDNLIDHLRLSDDDKRVHIFHHASFLECQRQSEKSLLPDGLAEETLLTLKLLLPAADSETRRWFSKEAATAPLDGRAIQCGRLRSGRRQIESFRFWRDRLVTLKQVFDETQPRTLSQWWNDRRNGVQWYTFWVAVLVLVLTVLFGFIQSVEGALQVYASFKSISGPA
ncbi:hypothetical protein diail_4738 [Diaporthe ilicicola]|nr:hypothetical protein diail_4738 [Diaporthe ilicicola]